MVVIAKVGASRDETKTFMTPPRSLDGWRMAGVTAPLVPVTRSRPGQPCRLRCAHAPPHTRTRPLSRSRTLTAHSLVRVCPVRWVEICVARLRTHTHSFVRRRPWAPNPPKGSPRPPPCRVTCRRGPRGSAWPSRSQSPGRTARRPGPRRRTRQAPPPPLPLLCRALVLDPPRIEDPGDPDVEVNNRVPADRRERVPPVLPTALPTVYPTVYRPNEHTHSTHTHSHILAMKA